MKYYLVKILTNTMNQDASSISVYDDYTSALINYHNTLAAFHNAEDVLYAVVKIDNEYGDPIIKEIVNHRPPVEPTVIEEE